MPDEQDGHTGSSAVGHSIRTSAIGMPDPAVPRFDRWKEPHAYEPDRRYVDFATDPWHYTTWHGLEGILTDGVIWASESSNLNDPSEVIRAADSLLDTWEASIGNLVADAPRDEVDSWLREMTSAVGRRRFYFVSACLDGDKLQHWKSYAGGAGYALEFSRNSEYRIVGAPTPLFRPGFAPFPWWKAVTYGDYDSGRSSSGGSLFHGREGIVEHALNEFTARARGQRPDEVAFWEHLESAYVSSVCFNKHSAYAEEEETRLAFLEPPFPGFVRERNGGYSPATTTRYLAITADQADIHAYTVTKPARLPILRVRVGPRYGIDLGAEIDRVTDLLRRSGYADVPVDASSIPYRG